MKKIKRAGVGLILLPVCYGASLALWAILHPFKNVPEGSFYFFVGIGSYFLFQWAFFRPIRTYVFGHELTHAVAAWLSGGKVRHFHVGKKGGSVSVTRSNFFVALSPYVVPLYALALLLLFFAVNYFYSLRAAWWPWFLWLLGASIGFHMALTGYALKQNQPDLRATGGFLSAVIIYLGNVLSIVFVLGVLFPRTVSWEAFARLSARQTYSALRRLGESGYWVYHGTVYGSFHRN